MFAHASCLFAFATVAFALVNQCAAFAVATTDPEAEYQLIQQSADHPKATGLLICRVSEDSIASKAGVQTGDILVSYNGDVTPDQTSLRRAVGTAQAKAHATTVEVVVDRAGTSVKFAAAPGALGLSLLLEVKQGIHLALRPDDTGLRFDFSRLTNQPIDAWFRIDVAGKNIGYEHDSIQLIDDKVVLHSELALDSSSTGGGIQHYRVSTTNLRAPIPRVISSRYDFSPGDFANVGTFITDKKSAKPVWHSKGTYTQEDEKGNKTPGGLETTIATSDDLVGDFGLEMLAAFLPHTTGGCCPVTVINTGAGDLIEKASLVIGNAEEIKLDGKPTQVARIDYYRLAHVARTLWIDGNNRIVRFQRLQYATQLTGELSNESEVISGLDPEMKPLGFSK